MIESASFIPLFVGFLFSVAGADSSCPLELNPPSVVVRYGDPVSINCSTSETLFDGIGWEVTHGATGLQPVKHLTWSLDSVTHWSISPKCFINPSEDSTFEQCLKTLEIVVYTFPDTIYISSDSVWAGHVDELKEYDFTCVIPDVAPVQNLIVKWYKGDELLKTQTFDDPSEKPVNQSSVLSFSATRQDNGVSLRCEAHLDLGPNNLQLNVSSQEYNITVKYGPELHCSAEGFLEGEYLEETCQVTGNPTPFVKWTKDGKPVDPAIRLSRENSGLYAVEAEGASALNKTIEVLVMYGPELSCTGTHTMLEYTPHNLTCTFEGFPRPEIIWSKDGEEVYLPDNLTRRDAGQYIITASNIISSVNLSLDITVLYPPSPIVELEDSEVDIGSTMRLKCSSTGNPRPKYSWDYYRTENVEEKNEDGVSYLQIHKSTAYNMGSYTCHAWNDIGYVSETARVTVKGAKQECPIEITLDGRVIQYQERSKKATCKPTTNSSNVKAMYWLDQQGLKTNTSWTVDTHKDWEHRPECIGIFQGIGLCKKRLDFTLYKTPDSVSIQTVGDKNSVVEDNEFQLQCDITNVAPAQNLTVRWYRGNETIQPFKESTRVTGCLENNTTCDISAIQSPLNVSSIISVTMNRTHNGAELRCEVQLDLGPEGPQPVPSMTSSSLNITVYYKPVINTTKLAKRVPVFSGYPEDLVCEADGHPPPNIVWVFSPDKVPHVLDNKLTVSEAGVYNCTATNEVDSISYEVEVILKEDYLPLIAGFVAVTVIAISIIFVFFYSIYYKNTKMRRYSLKNPKLSTHNGNVAHNGWDLQFPMTTLS